MTEREYETQCMGELERRLPRVLLWKIHDTVTGGQPDLEINWNGATTKIEFKKLKATESIHNKWEDGRQLVTLVRYEQQTTRAWVVAYVPPDRRFKGDVGETRIYRPTKLLNRAEPQAPMHEERMHIAIALWDVGMIRCSGIRHDIVARLIRETHI